MSKNQSIALTKLIIKCCYVLLAAGVIAFPFLIDRGDTEEFFGFLSRYGRFLIIPFYCVVPEGYAALICLDKLLSNVKKGVIFDSKNIALLNNVSLSCFAAAAVGAISFIVIAIINIPFETLIILPAAEAFMGLVVSVVKTVFEAAIEIKEDNDLVV